MRTNDEYVQFFLQAQASVVRIECLELYHPSFSQHYYVVRNATQGITVRHEDGIDYEYMYYPLRIKMVGLSSNLDFGIDVDLGDLGDLVPNELSRITGDAIRIKPTVIYRSYRSDALDKILEGPFSLEAKQISYNRDGCSFKARPKTLNNYSTGEIYDLTRFYPLRGFLY